MALLRGYRLSTRADCSLDALFPTRVPAVTLFGLATTVGRLDVDPVWPCVGLNTPTFVDSPPDTLGKTLLTVRERVSAGAAALRGTLTFLLTAGRSTAVGRAGSAGRAGAVFRGTDIDRGMVWRDTLGIFGAVGRGIETLFRRGARWT